MKGNITKCLILPLIILFLCLGGCKNDNKDSSSDPKINTPSLEQGKCSISNNGQLTTDKFSITIDVRDTSGNPLSDVSVRLSPLVMERKILKIGSYKSPFYKLSRYKTDNQGRLTLSDLSIKITATIASPVFVDADIYEADQANNYSITVMKSGYDPVELEIGNVANSEISISCQMKSWPDAVDIKLALLDYEHSYRATDFLARNKLLYTDLTGKLGDASTDLAAYKILALGLDASKFYEYATDFIGYDGFGQELNGINANKIKTFIQNGGTLFFFQQNDDIFHGFFKSPLLPGYMDDIEMVLLDENPNNDFDTGGILDASHILVTGKTAADTLTESDLKDWQYEEPLTNKEGANIVFDAIKTYTGWTAILGAPGTGSPEIDINSGITANKYKIAAEIQLGTGWIFMCQGAYYQGSYGRVSVDAARKMSANIVHYLKVRAGVER